MPAGSLPYLDAKARYGISAVKQKKYPPAIPMTKRVVSIVSFYAENRTDCGRQR